MDLKLIIYFIKLLNIIFMGIVVMQAIILAAGMGKRLKELTNDVTKCMVK